MDWPAYCQDKAAECEEMAAQAPGALGLAWHSMASAWREAGGSDEDADLRAIFPGGAPSGSLD